jgi:hypothetical protein
MPHRQRGRVLPVDGITAVKNQLSNLGWNNNQLADYAALSVSTIKRMLQGKPTDLASLKSALTVLGLAKYLEKIQFASPVSAWQELLSPKSAPIFPVDRGPSHPTDPQSFFMNATFQDNKLPQIKSVLMDLDEQLIDSECIIDEQNGRLTVSGVFTSEARASVEATIRHLERLSTSCRLTGDIRPVVE